MSLISRLTGRQYINFTTAYWHGVLLYPLKIRFFMGDNTEISDAVKDAKPAQSYRQLEKREEVYQRPHQDVRQMPRPIAHIVRNRHDYNF